MKRLLIVLFTVGLAFGASAQRFHGGGGVHVARPRVVVSTGFYSPFYSPFYNPYWGYPYYAYPSPNYGYRPTRLDMQIQDIKNDYQARIYSAKQDKSLRGKQRREKVRELKHERDREVNQAKVDYYKTPRNYNYRNNNRNNGNNGNNE